MRFLKLFVSAVLFTTGLAFAQAPTESPVTPEIAPRTCLTIEECTNYYGNKYSLPKSKIDLMRRIIYCESSNNKWAVGDGGTSFGLSQIHLPAHPDVSKEEAFDFDFAIDFMAREFSKNNMGIWSCYHILEKI
jgi:hypothetical protein